MEKLTDRQVREKLATRGVENLSDAELLSILLREGTGGKSALEIAEGLLEVSGGSLSNLSRTEIAKLRMSEGIGMNRAAQLAAAFEIAGRVRMSSGSVPSSITNNDDVVAIFQPIMERMRHEEMWALYLSSANGVIDKSKVSQGGVTSLVADTKLIIKRAVELLASSIILVHNHPSGIAEPSSEDIALTQRIASAAALFDITLMDHIIIAGGSSYSFRGHGLVK